MHEGQTLRKIIKKNGYPISTLAYELGISRTALYNKLKREKLPPIFLKEVKRIMGDGLIQIFPKKSLNARVGKADFIRGQWHYIRLLKQCSFLLKLTIKILNQSKKKSVRKEVAEFIESLSLDLDMDD